VRRLWFLLLTAACAQASVLEAVAYTLLEYQRKLTWKVRVILARLFTLAAGSQHTSLQAAALV
jgi:hypothetical protein